MSTTATRRPLGALNATKKPDGKSMIPKLSLSAVAVDKENIVGGKRKAEDEPVTSRTRVKLAPAKSAVASKPAAASSAAVTARTKGAASGPAALAAAKKGVRPTWDVKGQLEDAEKALADLRTRLASGEDASSLLQVQHDEARRRVSELQDQLDSATSAAAALEARFVATEQEMHNAQSMVENLKRELDDAHEEHSVVVGDLRAACAENVTLKVWPSQPLQFL